MTDSTKFESKDKAVKQTKVLTVGELRKLLADAPAEMEIYTSVQMNDDTGHFPIEDIQTDTNPILLLCGEEVIMLIEE